MLPRLLARAAAVKAQAPAAIPVPLAAARAVSRRWLGLVAVPPELEKALADSTAALSAESGRQLARSGRRLVDALRRNSRTSARGGLTAAPVLDADSGLRARPKQRRRVSDKTLLRQLRHSAVTPFEGQWSDDEDEAPSDVFPQAADTDADALDGSATSGRSPAYDTAESAAYAATRFAATYAVLQKVMDELQSRRPDFQPSRMLDFGAGPGTAIWAAAQVWGGEALQTVHAVEKAAPMLALGHSCHKALRATGMPVPAVRWSRRLAPRPSDSRLAVQRYDLVVASYVLAELRSPAERRKVVQALWERTRGLLLLVEPGTPIGSANVREARTQVLSAKNGGGGGGAGGAHVVAPCPHDSGCPMDGTSSWCHFAQRFQRTALQKTSKILPGGARPRDYQDERFSYVVLQRGGRPEVPAGVFLTSPEATAAAAPEVELLEEDPEDDVVEEVSLLDSQQPDEETLRLILDSIRDGADDSDEDEVQQAEEFAVAFMQDQGLTAAGAGPQEQADVADAGSPSSHPAAAADSGSPAANAGSAPISTATSDDATTPQVSADAAGLAAWDEEGDADRDSCSPEELAMALAASGAWSRVVRPPRKKSGHVVLDLCSAGSSASAKPRLQQHIVSRASHRLGIPLYRLARKLRWGDLWPLPEQL